MKTIELSRVIDAPKDDVRAAIEDVEPFMRAAGFDEVDRDGDSLEIGKAVGLLKISLSLRLLDDPDAVLAYEQLDGIFEAMTTTYALSERDGGTEVSVRTAFELGAPGGSLLDGTIIKRQRTKEIEAQFEYLEQQCE